MREATPDPVADACSFGYLVTMTWLAEILIQSFWEGVVHVAYRKWGLTVGAFALFALFFIVGLLIWMIAG